MRWVRMSHAVSAPNKRVQPDPTTGPQDSAFLKHAFPIYIALVTIRESIFQPFTDEEI